MFINLVRIDRSTFRRNPDAGATMFRQEYPPDIEAMYRGAEGDYRFGPCEVIDITTRPIQGKFVCIEASWPGSSLPKFSHGQEYHLEFDGKPNKNWLLEIRSNDQILHSRRPLPNWLFDYAPSPIKCPGCDKETLHTDLSEDEFGTEDGEVNGVACPHCSEVIELQYEDPEDVAKELGLTSAA